MKAVKDISQKIETVTQAIAKNGKLDKATVDSALDRILINLKAVDAELDQLLARARG